MKRILLLLSLITLAPLARADDLTPGKRTLTSPDFEKRYSVGKNDRFADAIRDATAELLPQLAAAESIIIYSLYPKPVDEYPQAPTNGLYFHGYKILGSKMVWRPADLATWRQELVEGLKWGTPVMCFYPRHAIRIHTKQTTIDMILCFECGHMYLWGLHPKSTIPTYFFDADVLRALNQFLDAGKIKREPPP